jgi:integration host factor subunit beta
MSVNKFTRSGIWQILQAGTDIAPNRARELTGKIIDGMAAALVDGKVIELRGLGTLEPRERKARAMRNPRTMAPVNVPARRVIFFKPSGKLKRAINSEADQGTI